MTRLFTHEYKELKWDVMPHLFSMIKFPRLVFALLLFVSFYSINRGRKVDCRSTKTSQTFIEYPARINSSNFVFFLFSLWQETRVLHDQRLAGALVTCMKHDNSDILLKPHFSLKKN